MSILIKITEEAIYMYKQFLMYYNGILNKNRQSYQELLKNESFVLFFVIMVLLLISLLYSYFTGNTIGLIMATIVFIIIFIVCSRCDSKRRLNNYVCETEKICLEYEKLFREICKDMKIKNNKEFEKLIDAFDYKIEYGYIEKDNAVKCALISAASSVFGLIVGKIIELGNTAPNYSASLLVVLLLTPLIVFFIFLLVQAINKFIEYKLYNELRIDQLIQLRDYAKLLHDKKLIFKH